jgi:MFS family permease
MSADPENILRKMPEMNSGTKRWRKVSEFLGLRRNTSLLLGAIMLALTSEKLWLGFAPKYLQTLGAGIFIIGLFDALQTFLGAIYAYPGGWLTDHWGQRRSLLLFNALTLGGYVLVLVWQHWLALVIGVFLFVAWSGFSLPTTFAVVATSLEKRRHTMGVGMQSLVRRVPMMIGPVIGGWLITRFGWQQGIRYALLGSISLSAATAVFQWFISEPAEARPRVSETPRRSFSAVVKSFNPTLRELLVSDILIRFCERLPYAFIILWAMNHGEMSAAQFGWLLVIEKATGMICYIPVAHLADKYGQRPFVFATFIFFTLFPLSLLVAHTFASLAVAFAVRGLKEFGEPARKALIIAQAPAEFRGRTYGAYYLIRDCIVTLGSFLGAWLWSVSPRANFLGAAACGVIGTLWFWLFVLRRKVPAQFGTTVPA